MFVEDISVQNPRVFPPATIARGGMMKGKVIVEPGRVADRHILFSLTLEGTVASSYEIGRTLRECIYGQVRHCICLTQSTIQPNFMERTQNYVAVKIYIKVIITIVLEIY